MNMANTMIMNITTKKQEYGILQAVGMTNKQLNLCLQLQGLIFTVGTICVALIIGLPLGYALFSYAKHNGIFGMKWIGEVLMADKIGTDEYGEILIYQTDDGQTNIEVKIEDDTVWLTQQQMSELFQTSRTNVVEHIKHIYEEGELDEISTCRNFRQVRKEGNREVTRQIPHYNLDMIISLGYRIKSVIATRFRQWATKRLKEYMIKGFTIDDERLKGNGGGNYWKVDDYVKQLDSVLSSGNRKLLTGSGSVSHKQALEKAKSEYRKYQEITLTPVEKAYLESIKEVSKEVKRR